MANVFEVLDGGMTKPHPYVCPWCAEVFMRRNIASDGVMSLEEHWIENPQCKAHAKVNNPTQQKSYTTEQWENREYPGEHTLALVDKKADHE